MERTTVRPEARSLKPGCAHDSQAPVSGPVHRRHDPALPGVLPFLRDHGLDLRLFVEQLFANPVSGFFGMDVIVSSVVLWTLVLSEGRRLGMKNLWAPIAANLAVGVSLGLPLFLYMRERTSATKLTNL